MDLGELLSGAGDVGSGWRNSTDAQRASRLDELRRQEQARMLAEQARMREMNRDLAQQGSISRTLGLPPDLGAPATGNVWGTGPKLGAQPQAPQVQPRQSGLSPRTQPGNIDLSNRPQVRNANGTTSTVRSISVNFDGKEYLIPTVSDDGRVMSNDEAVATFQRTGKHLGVFNTPAEATAAGKKISKEQEKAIAAPKKAGLDESKLPQHLVDNAKLQSAIPWYGQGVANTGIWMGNQVGKVVAGTSNALGRLHNAFTGTATAPTDLKLQAGYYDRSNIYQNKLKENAQAAGIKIPESAPKAARPEGTWGEPEKPKQPKQGQQRPQSAGGTAPQLQFTVQPEPSATADAVVAAAAGGIMYGDTGTPTQNPHIQGVLAQRQMLVDRIKTMEQYGFGDRALELLPQIQAIDSGLYKVAADQSIYEASTSDNFSRAMGIVSSMSGQPHQVLSRGDGTYDYYVNGEVAKTGMDKVALLDMLQSRIDDSYVERKNARNDKIFEHQLTMQQIITEHGMDAKATVEAAFLKLQAARVSGDSERMKPSMMQLQDGNALVLLPDQNKLMLVRPDGFQQEVKGVPVTSATTQVMSLPGVQ